MTDGELHVMAEQIRRHQDRHAEQDRQRLREEVADLRSVLMIVEDRLSKPSADNTRPFLLDLIRLVLR